LRIKKLKEREPFRYDMPEEEWDRLYREFLAERNEKIYMYYQLCGILDTPLKVQEAAGLSEMPPTIYVQSRPIMPEKPSETIAICPVEIGHMERVDNSPAVKGSTKCFDHIELEGEIRTAEWFEKTNDN